MVYLGGKDRIGGQIARKILSLTQSRDSYLECCFGGGSSFQWLGPQFKETKVGDVHEDLIAMWQAIKEGWRAPTTVSEAEYKSAKSLKSPNPLKGFVGFSCSFGAKWFGGYARDSGRNFAGPQAMNVDRIGGLLKLLDTMIVCTSYDGWNPGKNTVVYADPPYAGGTQYKQFFDHNRFWKIMDKWTENGAEVFVSEYNAPSHWKCVLNIDHACMFSYQNKSVPRTEKLFTRQ